MFSINNDQLTVTVLAKNYAEAKAHTREVEKGVSKPSPKNTFLTTPIFCREIGCFRTCNNEGEQTK